MNIVVFSSVAGIVATLSIRYDDCRRHKGASWCGGSVNKIQKNSRPAVPWRGPEAGSFVKKTIFMVWVRTESIHICSSELGTISRINQLQIS
jgi:hypothetical protein